MKIAALGLTVTQVQAAIAANNSNGGGGFYSQGGQFFYVRGLGRIRTLEDIGNIVLAVHDGTPILVKDVAQVKIGIAPRLGEFGYMNQDDAVEGVILALTGSKTQDVLQRVEAKTQELNQQVLPRDVKIHPFYDLTTLIQQTTRRRHAQPDDRAGARDRRAGLLPVRPARGPDRRGDHSAGAAVRFPAASISRAPRRTCLSIGAVDFGILVDGAIFMVENIFRELAARRGTDYRLSDVILSAAAEIDRPLVYAVAVIVASFLPIYFLTGPSGTLFRPMADTMIFALIGSLVVTLTLLPVLCAVFMRRGVRERLNPVYEKLKAQYARALQGALQARVVADRHPGHAAAARAADDARSRRGVHADTRRGRALGTRDDAVHDLVAEGR